MSSPQHSVERILKQVVDGTARVTGEDYCRSLVHQITEILGVRYAFISRACANRPFWYRIVAIRAGDEYLEPFEYDIHDTPCEEVFRHGRACYPHDVSKLFPGDAWLRENSIDSYLAIPIHDAAGNPLGHFGIMDVKPLADIDNAESVLNLFAARAATEIERQHYHARLLSSHQELEAQRARLNEAQRLAHLGFWEWDAARDEVIWDEEMCRIFGYTVSDYPRTLDGFMHILHRDSRESVRQQLDVIFSTHEPFDIEYKIVRPDGDIRCLHEHGYVTGVDAAGNIAGMFGVVQDVTARETMIQALRESEQRFRILVERAAEGFYLHDLDGRILDVNPYASDILGYSREEFLGLSLTDLDVSKSPQQLLADIRGVTPGVAIVVDGEHRHKDGRSIPVEIRAQRFKSGEQDLVLAMVHDVSERKAAERALRRRQRQLEILSAANRQLNSLLDTRAIVRELVKTAMQLTDTTAGAAGRMRDGEMCFDEYFNDGRLIAVDNRFKPGVGVPGHVMETGKSYIVNDTAADPYVATGNCLETGFSNCAVTPIFDRRRSLIGCIQVHNTRDGRPFDEQDTGMLEGLAEGVAVALENARILAERTAVQDELRRALDEVESMRQRLEAENVYLQEEIRTEHNFEEIITGSPACLDVLAKITQVAPTNTTVLIQGETGTGKELIARAIHSNSNRRDRPLVKVNCGAIAAGLVESELFGHERGAFTGATQKRIGRFELADGGTVFLDEISELPLEMQVKLLRLLQEQEFERVGNSKPIRVDVRVIAATNRNLKMMVEAGEFRKDLYYRINVFPLYIPPLRERRGDIPLLVEHMLNKYARMFGKSVTGVSDRSMQRMIGYGFPGNVRELENIIEHAMILAQGPVLDIDPTLTPGDFTVAQGPVALDDVERRHILQVLQDSDWRIAGPGGAAELLGLNPSTLRSRMKKLGIRKP